MSRSARTTAIDGYMDNNFALVEVKEGLSDAWAVKDIADLVSIQVDLELEAIN